MSNAKGSEQDADSEGLGAVDPNSSPRKDLLSASELMTPRMRAEAVVSRAVQSADLICDELAAADYVNATVAGAMTLKVKLAYLQYVLDAANAIGGAIGGNAANGGRTTSMQLPAAGLQSGSLATMLAQRLANKRNAHTVVQRRIVEVAQPIASEANSGEPIGGDK